MRSGFFVLSRTLGMIVNLKKSNKVHWRVFYSYLNCILGLLSSNTLLFVI